MDSIHEQINNLTVARLTNIIYYGLLPEYSKRPYANNVTRPNYSFQFGAAWTTLSQFATTYGPYKARGFKVRAWLGPPRRRKYYEVSLDKLLSDWYNSCMAENDTDSMKKLEAMLCGS